MSILDTGVRKVKNVSSYRIGKSSRFELPKVLNRRKLENDGIGTLFFVDAYFEANKNFLDQFAIAGEDHVIFVASPPEPTTQCINVLMSSVLNHFAHPPSTVVAIGGGSTMDVAKAVANLITNGGLAEDYQGWDLVKKRGVYKIAVPTISGTGAEATRTCVMTNKLNGLKLGMNSDYTVFDEVFMDPVLTATVPRNQYFFSGMDAYIHSFEALNGDYRNVVGDSLSEEATRLTKIVFASDEMMSFENRQRLMVASFLGGCAIATSYVGVVHPFSAGLSVVLGTPHCLANCIAMRAMEKFYPKNYDEFWAMASAQKIKIPEGICDHLSESELYRLYDATIMHDKPLTNALGENFKQKLTKDAVIELFLEM